MFGKKKREELSASVSNVSLSGGDVPEPPKGAGAFGRGARPQDPVEPQLTPRQIEILAFAKDWEEDFGGFVTPNGVASSPSAVVDSQMLGLLFGIFSEIRKLREAVERMNEQG